MNPDETRRFLDGALSEFRTAMSPDSRLRSLWKIGQLVEDATDEEVYELASAVAIEEDHRLRGEICYAISRSQRPQLKPRLVQILRGAISDEDPYVRRSAISALSELAGLREATLAAVEPILDDVEQFKSTVVRLEEKVLHLRDNVEKFPGVAVALSSAHEIKMDDYMRCWETYLRNERELLMNHEGKYVAIYGKEIVGIDEDEEKLAEMVEQKYGSVEAIICRIEEEGEPLRMPPPREILN